MNPYLRQIKTLEDQIAELKQRIEKETEYKAGDWIVSFGVDGERIIGRLSERKDYGWRLDNSNIRGGEFFMDGSKYDKCKRHATKEEIEQHLIKEAEKRGFKKGVNIVTPRSGIEALLCSNKMVYEDQYKVLIADGYVIYADGKWATIIEDKLMIDKYEVRFIGSNKKNVDIGGISYYKAQAETLLNMTNFKALIMHDYSGKEIRVEKKQIETIYERLK